MIFDILAQAEPVAEAGPNYITPIAAVIIALLGGGGLYALLKVRPEAAAISVTAAQGAVLVQKDVITTLENENKRLDNELKEAREELRLLADRVAEMSRLLSKNEELESRITRLEAERDRYRTEAHNLRNRVQHLETKLKQFDPDIHLGS